MAGWVRMLLISLVLLQFIENKRMYNDQIQTCPTIVNDFLLHSYSIPFGMKDRALKTVPPEFTVGTSSIAGLGVFSNTFIPKFTWLAEYDGVKKPLDMDILLTTDVSAYQWLIYAGKTGWKPVLMNDAMDVHTSNWIRYINCARNGTELNVWPYWCYSKVYYITIRDLYPSQELLTYYGPYFADAFNIDTSTFPEFK